MLYLVSHFVLCSVSCCIALLCSLLLMCIFGFALCWLLHSLLLSFHNFHNGNAVVCGVNTMKWKCRKQQFDSSDYWGTSALDNICTHMSPSTVNIGFLSGKAPLQTALWQEKFFRKNCCQTLTHSLIMYDNGFLLIPPLTTLGAPCTSH